MVVKIDNRDHVTLLRKALDRYLESEVGLDAIADGEAKEALELRKKLTGAEEVTVAVGRRAAEHLAQIEEDSHKRDLVRAVRAARRARGDKNRVVLTAPPDAMRAAAEQLRADAAGILGQDGDGSVPRDQRWQADSFAKAADRLERGAAKV